MIHLFKKLHIKETHHIKPVIGNISNAIIKVNGNKQQIGAEEPPARQLL